jgi:hypothetical protein
MGAAGMTSLSCHSALQALAKIVGSYFLRRTASVNLADTLRESLLSGWIYPRPGVSGLSETSGAQVTLGGVVKNDQYPFAFGAFINAIELQIHVHSFAARDPCGYLANSLTWLSFTRQGLKDSRPITDWERKAAAEFFWSEFD